MKKLLLFTILTVSLGLRAQVPGCATLVSPANGATNVPVAGSGVETAVSLAWTAPTTGGVPTGYKLRWGTSIAGMTVLGTTPNLGVNITGILFSTTYYWQALATNAAGDSVGCSPVFSLTTSAVSDTNCLFAFNGVYPAATFTVATCDGVTSNTVAADSFAGEVSNINVTAGQTYKFQSSVATDYIKIATVAAPTVVAAGGTTPVIWTAATTGIIRFYIHTDNICNNQSSNRVRSIVCGASLKLDSFDGSIFSISPNPANDFVTISNSENIKVSSVKITDLNGRVIKQSSFDNVSDIQMNVSDLSSGIYIMNINSNEGSVSKKIIKN